MKSKAAVVEENVLPEQTNIPIRLRSSKRMGCVMRGAPPVLAVGEGKHLDFLAGLEELEVDRESGLAKVLRLVVILIAGLVPPPADEIAGRIDLDQ